VKTILFVHQSADTYGSDKVLFDLACCVQDHNYYSIVVVPVNGPLVDLLRNKGVEVHVTPVAKLSRSTFSLKGLALLPIDIWKSMRAIDVLLCGRHVDLVHSNTLAVLGGAFWARRNNTPHLWHVHELILFPKLASMALPWLLACLADKVICNSRMTEKWVLSSQPKLSSRTVTVWNGLTRPANQDTYSSIKSFKQEHDLNSSEIVTVALVGRINRMKGQGQLIKAAEILWEQNIRNVRYIIVGSPPHGQEYFLSQLKDLVNRSPVRSSLVLMDFIENIWPVWEACDIAVVPSTEPESFGLVAIEAMSVGKPVVAAGHGGLIDIIDDGRTGILVTPGDPVALANALQLLIGNPLLRRRLGEAGRIKQEAMFSLSNQITNTLDCYESMIHKNLLCVN
jgi:glycosyltransferase involved in cell wall biosynthesis